MAELLTWHRVGQEVVCLKTHGGRGPKAKKGHVYRVCEVFIFGDSILFGLEGLPVDMDVPIVFGAGNWLYVAEFFRPARNTSIESLRALLSPTPDEARPFFREMIDDEKELAAAGLTAGWRR